MHTSAVAPVTFETTEPRLHPSQLACPAASWYCPAPQETQCEPFADEYRPASHSTQTPADTAPATFEAEPGRQATQLGWPVEFWYWPAAQDSHCVPSADEECPAPHSTHASAFEAKPGWHATQLAWLVAFWYVPATQDLHMVAPP